jgi:uncharacterized cupredoxin-like copper-binding protein
MSNKIIILVIAFILVASAVVVTMARSGGSNEMEKTSVGLPDAKKQPVAESDSKAPVKEFSMTSFTVVKDGKYFPQFSLKEITVNKGDRVRIKITVTSGKHDFKLDEYGLYTETEMNKEAVVEFVADKAGEFVYYCNMPGHRANGHWGTLKVLDK